MSVVRCQEETSTSAARLEKEADRLIRTLPRDPRCPTHTEAQLQRPHRDHHIARLDGLPEGLVMARPVQSLMDELLFLSSITPLERRERICLRGWLLGWTQREIGAIWFHALDRRTQQTVSRLLRSALRKCYSTGLTFTQFSHHTIYRRPQRRPDWHSVTCPRCGEIFAFGLGAGRYCSTACREQRRRKER